MGPRRWLTPVAIGGALVLAIWIAHRPLPSTGETNVAPPLEVVSSPAVVPAVDSPGVTPIVAPTVAPADSFSTPDDDDQVAPVHRVSCKRWKGDPDVFAAGGVCWSMVPRPAPFASPTP